MGKKHKLVLVSSQRYQGSRHLLQNLKVPKLWTSVIAHTDLLHLILNIVILLWCIEKCLNGTHNLLFKSSYWEVWLFTILLLWRKKMVFQKICIFFLEINVKWLFIQGVKKEFSVQHPVHFWPFLRAPAEKLMPHSQISFKSWLRNAN